MLSNLEEALAYPSEVARARVTEAGASKWSWSAEGAIGARLLLAIALPGVPFMIARWFLHQHSGVLNLDYLLVTLLAWIGCRRTASALFVATYALEFVRVLDAIFWFSQQDVAYAVRFLGDVPVWLTALWAIGFALLCAAAVRVWLRMVPGRRGPAAVRAASVVLLMTTVLTATDLIQGFNPWRRGPDMTPRTHLIGELLVRMPLAMVPLNYERESVSPLQASATAPLWGPSAVRADRENVVVVVVESMGLLNDPAARSREFAALDDAAIQRRYRVDEGSVPFHGPTVSGEMRELCHLRTGVHIERETFVGQGPCLPEQFRELGYETAAFHGFRGTMFRRREWYPEVGFRQTDFFREMKKVRMCNGAFFGVCDSAVAERMETRLAEKTAAHAGPQFLYWMTLNGHLPIDLAHAPQRACPVAADAHVCGQLAYTENVLDAVRRLALDPKIGRTAIIVVGDHAPPYLDPERRDLFSGSSVPYVTLLPRG